MRNIGAKRISFSGFASSCCFTDEEIDKAKLCILHAIHVDSVLFAFTDFAQMEGLLSNDRELPKSCKHLQIHVSPTSPVCGKCGPVEDRELS